ncbi:ATP-grasp domain-containing protein [Sansalvadorimonas verongulae]|uniref:ATP-grasp domain-containing protein n=1 Tax=Sansalvadorimonas verongulae TaxID=2172824 RepID=UPI0012BB8F11|nr:sugar-transfer associated ATP-grasp domain-containing protein [Sansalvadorimonas verongulae]MTI12757.1 ATP-grasp domain-containing protein [Sansalvadorimonas verongulae]
MPKHTVGLWLYQNGGGDVIQQKLIDKLKEREIAVITGLNLGNALAHKGSIVCNGIAMEELDLFFTYNAGQQTQYQMYLYEMLDRFIPIINNYHSFALTEDKFKTTHLLQRHGINTPDYCLCRHNNLDALRTSMNDWGGRAVYKPTDGWGGAGIVRLEDESALDMLQPFINKIDIQHFFVERFVKNDHTDYRIDIVDGEMVGCYGRQAPKDDWRTNITSGGHVINREPNDAVVELAKKAAKVTGLEIAGVDLIYDREHEEYVVLEVNGIPAFATPDQEALGIDFNDLKIQKIVELIERKLTVNKLVNFDMKTVQKESFHAS